MSGQDRPPYERFINEVGNEIFMKVELKEAENEEEYEQKRRKRRRIRRGTGLCPWTSLVYRTYLDTSRSRKTLRTSFKSSWTSFSWINSFIDENYQQRFPPSWLWTTKVGYPLSMLNPQPFPSWGNGGSSQEHTMWPNTTFVCDVINDCIWYKMLHLYIKNVLICYRMIQ